MSTTIAVSHASKEALRQLGGEGESYDAIIRKLISQAAWKRLDDRWNTILAEDEFIPLDELCCTRSLPPADFSDSSGNSNARTSSG